MHTSDVRKSLKDGCKDRPLSFFSSPPSHSGHKWVFLNSTHDLVDTEEYSNKDPAKSRPAVKNKWTHFLKQNNRPTPHIKFTVY